ncbi:MAG: HlyD family efflux transporter periplasmic adaptor subunit [Prevotellaceae bacterium]|nr:HlyD family efflux transporter periplasmic adaptor subunit [Prevotellaceae bacterium]
MNKTVSAKSFKASLGLWGALFLLLLAACSRNAGNYDATGTFDASEIIVSSEVAGLILSFEAEEGTKLTKGALIATIDSTQYYLQKQQLLQNIEATKANVPAVPTQLAPLEKQLEKQKQEQRRITNLYNDGAATQQQLDDINSAISVLERQIDAQRNSLRNSVSGAGAQVEALQVQIEQIDDRLKRCNVVAPIDGIVLSKYAQAGELMSAGKPLLKIADMDNVHLKAYLTSLQLTNIKLGQEVKVRADFGKGNYHEYDGKITWISDKSEFTPKNITTSDDRANMVYAVKIAVKNDGYLKLGMYGEVKFNQ